MADNVPADLGDPRLPPFFPLKTRDCQTQADKLFACLEIASVHNGDKDAPKRAYHVCQKHLGPYEACMRTALKRFPQYSHDQK